MLANIKQKTQGEIKEETPEKKTSSDRNQDASDSKSSLTSEDINKRKFPSSNLSGIDPKETPPISLTSV